MSSSDDDGELEFIGQFEKPPPKVLAEISLIDDDDDDELAEIPHESDSEITIIEYIPPPPSKTNDKNVGGKAKANSHVKKMSSHQKQLQNQSNGVQQNSRKTIDGGINDIVIVDGEQNDNNGLVVASKSLKKKKKRKKKVKKDLKSSKLESCNENGDILADKQEIGKKKKGKKKKNKKDSTISNDPVFVGKVLQVIPVPSIAVDSTTNFLNFYNQQNEPSIDIDSISTSTKEKESLNTNDGDNINVDDNSDTDKDKINSNIMYPSTCQQSISPLKVPIAECTPDIITSITITSPNNNSHVNGTENTLRKVELVQIQKLNKSDADLQSNDEQVQYVESSNELELITKNVNSKLLNISESSHEEEVNPDPEAQSMNHFIKRLGISQTSTDNNSDMDTDTCTSITIEETAKNDGEGLVVNSVSIKRKRSSSSRSDGDGVILITETDDIANPNKKQALNWRIDKKPEVEVIEQSEIEQVIKCAPICNEEITATATTTRKDCIEKDDLILMGPPPPPPPPPFQNLIVRSLTEDGKPNPWDPIVNREISNNNKLGLPNSWTQDVIDFYTKSYDEEFDLNSVFRSMRDSQYLWKTPYENIRIRNKYMRCRICNQLGHEARFCPDRGKLPVCTNCGLRGHTLMGENRTSSCSRALCLNCGTKSSTGKYEKMCQRCEFTRHGTRVICALCGMKGHVERACPDQWRRYHSTTSPLQKELLDKIPTAKDLRENNITPDKAYTTNKTQYKHESKLYCCNCTRRHHTYFHCQRSLYSKYSPNKPNVIVDLPVFEQVENEKGQDKNSTVCESTSKQHNIVDANSKQDEQEVIFIDSNLIPNKIENPHSSGSNNESRLCPSYSISSYETSRSSSTSSYASGYSKKNLDIIYSADFPKSISDIIKEPESIITFSQLTTTSNSSKSKPYSPRLSRSSDEVNKSSRKREASRNDSLYEHSSKRPTTFSNSPRSSIKYSPIKWVTNSNDRDRDSSSRRSNQRYYNDSYKYSRNRDSPSYRKY